MTQNIPNHIASAIVINSKASVVSIVRKSFSHFFSKEDIEDTIGETMLRAVKYYDSYDSSKDFFPWIYRIAFNQVIDKLESIIRQSPFDCDMEVLDKNGETVNISDIKGYSDPSYYTDSELIFDEFSEKWGKALANLSDIDRKHYSLIDAGYKPREIAQELGCSSTAASARKTRLREKLSIPAKKLAKEYDINLRGLAA